MELVIYSPIEEIFKKPIEWNHEDLKKYATEKAEYYKNTAYTDDQGRMLKSDRATVNKLVQALETKDREVKKLCLTPYEKFHKEIKESVDILREPIALMDTQISSMEEERRSKKMEEVKKIWDAATRPDWLRLEQIFDQRWLNATVSLKAVSEAVSHAVESIEKDCMVLDSLPEYSFEANEAYRRTLDLNYALKEGQRMAQIQRQKAQYEAEQARRKAEEEAKKAAEQVPLGVVTAEEIAQSKQEYIDAASANGVHVMEAPAKQWVGFKALLSTEDALALRDFFKSRNILFKAVGEN